MIEYIPHILLAICYLSYGVFTHRILCRIAWISNESTYTQCRKIEKRLSKFFVMLFWPVIIALMGQR